MNDVKSMLGEAAAREPDGASEVGVGPWEGEWPDDPRLDPDLLREGDRRNVVDRYRYWRHDAIVADLDALRHPFHVAIENWQHDFNIGSVVRTANAFARARGAHRGQQAVEPARSHGHRSLPARAPSPDGRGVRRVGARRGPAGDRASTTCRARVPLETYALPEACVLVFGQESVGLTDAVRRRPTRLSRSLNTARRARSTRARPRPLPCTRGCGQHGDLEVGHDPLATPRT